MFVFIGLKGRTTKDKRSPPTNAQSFSSFRDTAKVPWRSYNEISHERGELRCCNIMDAAYRETEIRKCLATNSNYEIKPGRAGLYLNGWEALRTEVSCTAIFVARRALKKTATRIKELSEKQNTGNYYYIWLPRVLNYPTRQRIEAVTLISLNIGWYHDHKKKTVI